MAERLIGTGTTNANGVASVTYRGNGRGKMDIIAKSGRIQSGTYEVLDCKFFDTGTDNVERWAYRNATLTKQSTPNGAVVTNPNSGFGTIYANIGSSSTWTDLYDFNAPLKIEFKAVAVTGTGSILLNDGVTPSQILFATYNIADNSDVTITVESNRWKIKVNNTESNWVSHSLANDFGIAIRLNNAQSSITFKDFKIYPI